MLAFDLMARIQVQKLERAPCRGGRELWGIACAGASPAYESTGHRQRMVVIATVRYDVAEGKRGSIHLQLTRSGRSLLAAHHGRLAGFLVLSSQTRSHRSRIELRAARRRSA